MPATRLRTSRLLLSPPRMADLPRILVLANDPLIGEMTLNIPHPYTEESAVFWVNLANEGREDGKKYIFAIRDGETEEFMGGIGIHHGNPHRRGELGYWIGAPHRRRGYVSEAAGRLIRFGFEELNLLRIQATHLVGNEPSGRVMTGNGMRWEADLTDYYIKNGQTRSVKQYRILRGEWAAPAASELYPPAE